MKNMVKWMLVWVISFSLVVPVGVAKAAEIDPEKVSIDIRAKAEAERKAREERRQRETIKKEIENLEMRLEASLDGLRGKSALNPLNDVRDNYVQALEKVEQLDAPDSDYTAFYRAEEEINNAIRNITYLADKLKSKVEKYSSLGGTNYTWSALKSKFELNEDNIPIVYDRDGNPIRFSRIMVDSEEEAVPTPKGEIEKAQAPEDERGSDSWSRVFALVDDDDDEKEDRKSVRESARTELVGCTLPEHNPAYDNAGPSSGERAFGLGALTLFGIGAGVLAGLNTSYLHKERKSLRHQMERASANGDSPFLYHGAYAALNYQNPLGGLGETLGPISMAISSILMPGNQGYLSQLEYLRNMRWRAIIDAMAQARASGSASASASRTVTLERELQSIESGLSGFVEKLENGLGGLDETLRNSLEQIKKEQLALSRTGQILTNFGQSLSGRASKLAGLSELLDPVLKGTDEFKEGVRNADQDLRDSGANKLTTQFTDNLTSSSSFSGSGNRSGFTTGPNGFLGAPGFPQTGGGGFDARVRFGPR